MAQKSRSNRMLITVNISGSSGPIRLLVNADDSVAAVMRCVLKEYKRQRRLPVLGIDPSAFDLCCANLDRALNCGEAIRNSGGRRFAMCKKHDDGASSSSCKKQRVDRFRWFVSKSLNLINVTSY